MRLESIVNVHTITIGVNLPCHLPSLSLCACVCPVVQGGGFLLGICGTESVRPRHRQRERRAAAGRVCSGHRGLQDQGQTPVSLQGRHSLR